MERLTLKLVAWYWTAHLAVWALRNGLRVTGG